MHARINMSVGRITEATGPADAQQSVKEEFYVVVLCEG